MLLRLLAVLLTSVDFLCLLCPIVVFDALSLLAGGLLPTLADAAILVAHPPHSLPALNALLLPASALVPGSPCLACALVGSSLNQWCLARWLLLVWCPMGIASAFTLG